MTAPTPPSESPDNRRPPYQPLRCTACGSTLSPLLEYTSGSYSEHRDHTGYECDDCFATWDKRGEPTPAKQPEQPPEGLCANCGGGIVQGYHHPWLHVGGWLLCPALPGEDKPSRIARPFARAVSPAEHAEIRAAQAATNGGSTPNPAEATATSASSRGRECPRCANEISDPDDVICGTCGADLPSASAPTEQPS